MTDIEFKTSRSVFATLTLVSIGGMISFAVYILFVRGPLWPIPRLLLLYEGNVAHATECITNPRPQRMFSWVALACLATAAVCLLVAPYGDQHWYVAAASAGLLYGWLTYVVFEFDIGRGLRKLGPLLFAPSAEDSKAATGALIGITFLIALVGMMLFFAAKLYFESKF